jgi:hypothetical protein
MSSLLRVAPSLRKKGSVRRTVDSDSQEITAVKTNTCFREFLKYLFCGLLITSVIGVPFLIAYICYSRSNVPGQRTDPAPPPTVGFTIGGGNGEGVEAAGVLEQNDPVLPPTVGFTIGGGNGEGVEAAGPPKQGDCPIFSINDPIFYEDFGLQGYLRVYGPAIHLTEAERTCSAALETYGLKREQIHCAQLFHGSSSASLVAFTDYCQRQGALIPTGILEGSGRIPFCGEFGYGRGRVNAEFLSTVWIGALRDAITYANKMCSCPWEPDREGIVTDGDLQKKRLNEWKNLTLIERELVSKTFPILYGIKSDRKDVHKPIEGIPREIGLKEGARSDEIKVIFVPAENIEYVKNILYNHGFSGIPIEVFPGSNSSHTPAFGGGM